MSEEILKALMQLFAIITKQDEGVSTLQRFYVKNFLEKELNKDAADEYLKLYDEFSGYGKTEVVNPVDAKPIVKRTSVKDSVRILALCKKINNTLSQRQKYIVLVRLLALVNADKIISRYEMEIVDTVAIVFKIDKKEFSAIKSFETETNPYALNSTHLMVIDKNENTPFVNENPVKHIYSEQLDGHFRLLHLPSIDLYFIKYYGQSLILLNGLELKKEQTYIFANGSSIKVPIGNPIYFSDVVSRFMSEFIEVKLSFIAKNIEYKFPNGKIGLKDVNISENEGKLIGFMGASGAGKTTLLNVLNGSVNPTAGKVTINGYDIHNDSQNINGVIGYVPQDDSLIEELSVYQNLYFNAQLCFRNLSKKETDELVNKVLKNIGLEDTKHLKVGNPLEKTISGGQRKRLNIGLELIREPLVLFVDEPTSGLSSRDSENIMDLLKELTSKGKLIFVVIHQPSSEIFKMFDKLVILDSGGLPIYYGNPVEAIIYFKQNAKHVNSDRGECPDCGKVDPELIFNIIEEKLVDDYGNFKDKRKIEAPEWYELYSKNNKIKEPNEITEKPEITLKIPSAFKQFLIFTKRDTLAKLKNLQYLIINLLEAPLLAFVLAFIIRYTDDPNAGVYLFRQNENIPAYMFMAVVVALFMGMSVSAEEIIRDRKLRKRETFLNLSRVSYLTSKTFIMFFISAIQTLCFVLIGNWILEIRDMNMYYWLVLFSTACMANMTGLNISAAFNSAVTVYILIPLLLIPQMILSGAMFNFDKLNQFISGRRDRVPVLAEVMTSRWAYEALAVRQFKDNAYEKQLYTLEKMESNADFKKSYLLPTLIKKTEECSRNYDSKNEYLTAKTENDLKILENNLKILSHQIKGEMANVLSIRFNHIDKFTKEKFNRSIADSTLLYLENLKKFYIDEFNYANNEKDYKLSEMQSDSRKRMQFRYLSNAYFNENLSDIVRNTLVDNRIIEQNEKLIQQVDLIYLNPQNISGFFDFRAHFYSPVKHFGGKFYDTFCFNVILIWMMTVMLFVTLYYDVLKMMMDILGKLKWKQKNL